MTTQVWAITYAQNATGIFQPFLDSLKTYRRERRARLVVIKGRYKNPTSQWSAQNQDHEWWDSALDPYLADHRHAFSENLICYADVKIQPTNRRPLNGYEVFAGQASGIFGHTTRALECIPTAKRMPRVLATTGAITVPNYVDSRAGKLAEAHHIFGALIVELHDNGRYHMRHVTACRDGSFTDLDRVYTPTGSHKAPPALALVPGDIHVRLEDKQATAAFEDAMRRLRPLNTAYHDVFNMSVRGHHVSKSFKTRHAQAGLLVRDEVQEAVEWVDERGRRFPDTKHHVIPSNHHDHLDKWLEEYVEKNDQLNSEFYHWCKHRMYEEYDAAQDKFPGALELCARDMSDRTNVHYLDQDEPLTIEDVELGFHGHIGTNGARPGKNTYAALGVKSITAHTHVAWIRDGNFNPGVLGRLNQGYNHLPSGWIQGMVPMYADLKRCVLLIIEGEYHG